MISRIVLASCFAAGLTAGCNNSSPGGPGASGGSAARKADTFTMTGPTMATTVQQGETDTIKMSLSRGNDFKQGVVITTDAPKGLTVKQNSTKIAAGDPSDFTFTVAADKTAPLGEHEITVTGKPDTGDSTSVKVKVKVTAGPKT